jgi:FkbM family methyltransferase
MYSRIADAIAHHSPKRLGVYIKMLKKSYLALLKYPPTRRLLRSWRQHLLRMCDQPEPYGDIARLTRAIRADLFIDVGCHTGDTLIRFLDEGVECEVAAFDPISTNLDEAHRKLASYPQVTFHRAALSDTDGSAKFHVNQNSQTSSLLDNATGNERSFAQDTQHVDFVEVPTMRLDTWISSNALGKERLIIKCDTQGAEELVVRGGKETFKSKVSAFYSEVMLDPMYEGQTSFESLRRLLENECGLALRDIYPCLHDKDGRAVQMDALWVKPNLLARAC